MSIVSLVFQADVLYLTCLCNAHWKGLWGQANLHNFDVSPHVQKTVTVPWGTCFIKFLNISAQMTAPWRFKQVFAQQEP